jgi:hypothetical protein
LVRVHQALLRTDEATVIRNSGFIIFISFEPRYLGSYGAFAALEVPAARDDFPRRIPPCTVAACFLAVVSIRSVLGSGNESTGSDFDLMDEPRIVCGRRDTQL